MAKIIRYPMTDANVLLQNQTAASAGLRANLVCRVLFAIIGTLLCWVPFRLLWRNGEFAAIVFIVGVVINNVFTVINSLLWRNDYWGSWWDGQGWCDLQVWLAAPLGTIYAAAIFAIMRHLAQQVGMMRVTTLSPQEKRRRNLIQAIIIFPVPLVQLAFTWFDLGQRYIIGTLVGCSATYDNSWPKILVYIIPPVIFALGSVPYAFLTWKRYRAISMASAAALSTNSSAASRANRTRRRLYQMSMSILVPYVPVMLAFFVFDINETMPLQPYDYYRIHYTDEPYPWDSIVLVPSWLVPFAAMNQPWIPILTTILIVLFFGMTQDAKDMYRRYALAVRLDKCWPALRDKGRPNGRRNGGSSNDDSKTGQQRPIKATTRGTTARSSTSPVHDFIMEDFAAPNIPAITVRPPSDLPNQHHEAIVSASGNPTVPPRGSSSLSMARPPVIPPRSSSIRLRGLLEQSPSFREKMASMSDDLLQVLDRAHADVRSTNRNNNRVRFHGLPEEGGGGGRSGMDWDTFAAGSSHRLDIQEGMERKESLRPFPDLTIHAANDNNKDDNKDNSTHTRNNSSGDDRCTSSASNASGPSILSKASSGRKYNGKGKGKEKARTGRGSIASSGCADDDREQISTPMLPLHWLESEDTEPRTPIAPMPSSGLFAPHSPSSGHFAPHPKPRSEDGLPVTPC
ncbi:pheromone A receptor-domain-containing protein [Apiospora saccharicola]|uniref:Pheromone A receptor-domain-containing protein n=1 Tax=Apiospora saccharicola TaxID=335842 RepID=A0ABR1WDE3_9PEZI